MPGLLTRVLPATGRLLLLLPPFTRFATFVKGQARRVECMGGHAYDAATVLRGGELVSKEVQLPEAKHGDSPARTAAPPTEVRGWQRFGRRTQHLVVPKGHVLPCVVLTRPYPPVKWYAWHPVTNKFQCNFCHAPPPIEPLCCGVPLYGHNPGSLHAAYSPRTCICNELVFHSWLCVPIDRRTQQNSTVLGSDS